jgi:hypothetical protein
MSKEVNPLPDKLKSLLRTWDNLAKEIQSTSKPKQERIALLRQMQTGLNKLAKSLTPRIASVRAEPSESNSDAYTHTQYGGRKKTYEPATLSRSERINNVNFEDNNS